MKKNKLVLALVAWDLVWKALAVRTAIKRREWKWALALLVINSGGTVPALYLARSRRMEARGAS